MKLTCASRLLVLGAALALAGCATTPPGEDARGAELRANATPVLAALASYHRDRGEYPMSLYELVPKYLRALPFRPALRVDQKEQLVEFSYFNEWPRSGSVTCVARLGATDWTCVAAK